jgi:acetyltransferase-like isoleucine patch superfamily enzyme
MVTLNQLIHKIYLYFLMKRSPIKFAVVIGVKVGGNCRIIRPNSGTFGSEPYLVDIGDNVTVAKGVEFITHDGSLQIFRAKEPLIELFDKVTIGDNVFVGVNSVLLPGTTIQNNVIVGAGSIVKGILEENSVYAGVPAKYICSLDEFLTRNRSRFSYFRDLNAEDKRKAIIERFIS